MQNYEIKLHDIKPLVEIQDYSLYYFLALVAFILLLCGALLYLFLNYRRKKNAFNIRKEHLKFLQMLDMQNAKQAAYQLTEYGATFENDTPQHLHLYEELVAALEEYKYKKYVDKFDEEMQNKIHKYVEMIDV